VQCSCGYLYVQIHATAVDTAHLSFSSHLILTILSLLLLFMINVVKKFKKQDDEGGATSSSIPQGESNGSGSGGIDLLDMGMGDLTVSSNDTSKPSSTGGFDAASLFGAVAAAPAPVVKQLVSTMLQTF
jgi:hypothetical protein